MRGAFDEQSSVIDAQDAKIGRQAALLARCHDLLEEVYLPPASPEDRLRDHLLVEIGLETKRS